MKLLTIYKVNKTRVEVRTVRALEGTQLDMGWNHILPIKWSEQDQSVSEDN